MKSATTKKEVKDEPVFAGGLCAGLCDDPAFNGRFFQDMAAARKEKPGHFDLVGIFAPLLDCQMAQHKVDSEIHQSRCDELRAIEDRIKAGQANG